MEPLLRQIQIQINQMLFSYLGAIKFCCSNGENIHSFQETIGPSFLTGNKQADTENKKVHSFARNIVSFKKETCIGKSSKQI